jgi:hypothetical protein
LPSTHEQTQAAKAVANVVAVTDVKMSDMMGSIGGIASAVEIAENAATDLEKLASNLSCRATQLNEHLNGYITQVQCANRWLKLGTSEQVCNAACKIAP